MFKNKTLVTLSIIMVSSLFLSACSAINSVTGNPSTGSSSGKPLSTQARTAVASMVSSASTATQKALSGTPIIAGGSSATRTTGTPSSALGTPRTTPGAKTTGSAALATPTPQGTSLATSASSSSGAATTPQPNPGVMKPVLDWQGPWADLLANIPNGYYLVSVDQLANELATANPPFLVDIREPSEVSQYGYIRGAVNIPYKSVLTNLDKLPALDQPIVVYSGDVHRGTIVLSALRLLGYTNAYVLDGGMSAWQKAKQPSESGTPNPPTTKSSPNIDAKKLADLTAFIDTGTYGIDPQGLSTWLSQSNKPIVVDVRERAETSANGAIQGSIQIPLRSLFSNLNQLSSDKTRPIVIIDSNGHRGTMAMMALRMIGYTNVRSVFGGFEAWVAAGLPVYK